MSGNASTQERILLTAERLFAENGIDQTSIRQINLAAGQRNSSATQYHFGSRDELIAAILDYRREAVNERRLELLDEIRRTGRERDPRAMAEALVFPVAELLGRDDGSSHFIAFTAQLIGHRQYCTTVKNPGPANEGLVQLLDMIRATLPDIPPNILLARIGMAIRQMFHELADYQRVYLHGGKFGEGSDIHLEVAGLVDAVAGILVAPVSPQAIEACTPHPSR